MSAQSGPAASGQHPSFDGRHNYLIVDGLKRIGRDDAVREVVDDSLALIRESGFAEYYDPLHGEACGGGRFTWTAAMVIEFLAMAER